MTISVNQLIEVLLKKDQDSYITLCLESESDGWVETFLTHDMIKNSNVGEGVCIEMRECYMSIIDD